MEVRGSMKKSEFCNNCYVDIETNITIPCKEHAPTSVKVKRNNDKKDNYNLPLGVQGYGIKHT